VSALAALGPRIAITGVFGLGLIYFALIVKTLRTYGTIYAKGERRTGLGVVLGMANSVAIGGLGQGGATATETEELIRGRERGVRGDRERGSGGATVRDERISDRESVKKEREKSGLRSVLGLGLTGYGELGSRSGMVVEAEVDLEKGGREEVVRSVEEVGEETMPGGL
jgi:hypothetical protein